MKKYKSIFDFYTFCINNTHMNKIKNRKTKIVLGILVLLGLVSCSPANSLNATSEPQFKILSLSTESREVVIISNESLDMSEYVLRQGETKTLYSLSGIHLEKEVAKKVSVPSNFLRKKNNSISLSRLEIVSVLEEI